MTILDESAVAELRRAHGEFERARGRVWVERVRVGLEYRRAMREVEDRVTAVRL
jgi:hypothetical protein